jgi:hypothetical protein
MKRPMVVQDKATEVSAFVELKKFWDIINLSRKTHIKEHKIERPIINFILFVTAPQLIIKIVVISSVLVEKLCITSVKLSTGLKVYAT